jgi:hypothetical protein
MLIYFLMEVGNLLLQALVLFFEASDQFLLGFHSLLEDLAFFGYLAVHHIFLS